MRLGIMQGRLVPPEAQRFQCFPKTRWRDEFPLAAAAGLNAIEWIYDAYGQHANPLASDPGINELKSLSARHGVQVASVCADWFMDFPLIGIDDPTAQVRWQRLRWLMKRCASLSIGRIVVPFVDTSAIRSPADADAVATGINALADVFDETQVELHLETALSPSDFAALLARLPDPRVRVNYDSGNSASLGYRPEDEFSAYGPRVGSVHLKDRKLGAGTVPLGEGDTDFDALFGSLARANYRGDFILQVARGVAGDELDWARRNVNTSRRWIHRLQPS
jgi:L-ribulose-5-phosphate 3-epimerase